MSLLSSLRTFIDVLEVKHRLLAKNPNSPKHICAISDKTVQQTQGPRLSITALEQLSFLVHDELHAFRRKHNERNISVELPAEILAHIFRFASLSEVSISPHSIHNFRMQTRRAIVSTCSHWRQIALNDPLLWQVVHIPWHTSPSIRPIYKHIDLEIERCKASMFSFKAEATSSDMPLLALLLKKNIHRIDDLDILWDHHLTIDSFLLFDGNQGEALGSVRYLSLVYYSEEVDVPDRGDIHLESAEFLKDLRLDNSFCIRDSVGWDFDEAWVVHPPASGNIESLHMEGWVETESAINLINSCAALRSLSWLTQVDSDEKDIFFTRLRPLLVLENLRIGGTIPMPWLVAIHAPNLTHLHVSSDRYNTDDDKLIPSIVFPKIASLVIEGFHDAPNIVQFLQNHRTLRCLRLMNVDPTPVLYAYLASTKASNSLSNLERLKICFVPLEPATAPHFLVVLEDLLKRRSGNSPLSSFELHYEEHIDTSIIKLNRLMLNSLLNKYPGMLRLVMRDIFSDPEWS